MNLEATDDEMVRIIDRGRDELFHVMVTGEAILLTDWDDVIAAALNNAAMSVLGGRYHNGETLPPKIRKEVVCPINEMLRTWKNHATPLALTLLLPTVEQPALSKNDIVEKANKMLLDFLYFRESPTSEYFTAKYFAHMVIHRVFVCAPKLYLHINQTAPHAPLDNLFALAAAAVAANIQEYRVSGHWQAQSVSGKAWKTNYYGACTLITEICQDVGQRAELD